MATPAPDGWIYLQPGWFTGFRRFFFPAIYPPLQTAETNDVTEYGFIFAGIILAFSLLVLLPGFKCKELFSILTRIIIGVFVMTAIMVCNYSQEWEVAHIKTRTQYRAGLTGEINASVGVLIGLRGINFTLTGHPVIQQFNKGLVNETINYNERISWDSLGFLVGRGGFGPYAGLFNREFREHQRKGSPYPILWAAEYFTVDGEGLRWGRHYLQAGYYTSIVLWTALPAWWLSLILLNMVLTYGALFSIFTGTCMLAGNVIYCTQRNPIELKIPFEDAVLTFEWGWAFWLCMFVGLFTVVFGIVVIILDFFIPVTLSEFFGVDFTQDLEEFYIEDPADSGEATEEHEIKHSWGGSRRRRTIILPKSMGTSHVALVESEEIDTGDDVAPPKYQRQPSNDMLSGFRRHTLFPSARRVMKQSSVPGSPPIIHAEAEYVNSEILRRPNINNIINSPRIIEENESYVDVPIGSNDIELHARPPLPRLIINGGAGNEMNSADVHEDEDLEDEDLS